jgi:hypothetical protein
LIRDSERKPIACATGARRRGSAGYGARRARHAAGVVPVQRRNARWNELASP